MERLDNLWVSDDVRPRGLYIQKERTEEEEFFYQHLPLVCSIFNNFVAKRDISTEDQEDLFLAMLEQFFIVIKGVDEDKCGGKPATFIGLRVRGAFIDEERKMYRLRGVGKRDEETVLHLSLDAQSGDGEGVLQDCIVSGEDEAEKYILRLILGAIFEKEANKIKPKARAVIESHFIGGLTSKEIAFELKISESYVSRILKRFNEGLRKYVCYF